MIIDCDTCAVREIACKDCVVTFLLAPIQEVSDQTAEAIELLSSRGMVPPMRFQEAVHG